MRAQGERLHSLKEMMSDDKKIDVYKVEVLDDNVQKYSSTTLSGGGGYVSAVNGTIIGETQAISSTVNHHVSQSMWVRDLASGKEMQLSLNDVQIPVRPGHQLWLAYDHRSERWERIVNEATGEFTYGNGLANSGLATKFRHDAKGTMAFVLLLLVPYLNFLGGIIGVRFLLQTMTTLSDHKVPSIGKTLMKALALGIGLFFASFWAGITTMVEPTKFGFFSKTLSIATVIVLISMLNKTLKAPYLAAAEIIDNRSERIDAALRQAKAG